MKAERFWGEIKAGNVYKILGEGRDYFRVSVDGKIVYAFKWVFRE